MGLELRLNEDLNVQWESLDLNCKVFMKYGCD